MVDPIREFMKYANMTINRLNSTNSLNMVETTHSLVWSAELYLYRGLNDLLPEEREKARKMTLELEDDFEKLSQISDKLHESYDRFSQALENNFPTKEIASETLKIQTELHEFNMKISNKLVRLRAEMVHRLLEEE